MVLPMVYDCDVVIVGAGLAGLACALRLKEEGFKVIMVEARDMVGGRASRGGADFVHGQHVTTWKYLERFGLKCDSALNGWAAPPGTVPDASECWVYTDGELRGPDRVHSEANRLFFEKIDELATEWIKAGKEDISLRQIAEKAFDQPPTQDEVKLMEGSMAEWHAADLADVSVYEDDLVSQRILDLAKRRPGLLSDDGDEGHWRIIGGHQGLCERMSQGQDIRLSQPVKRIEWEDGRACIHCAAQKPLSLVSRAAVITVPLACIPDLNFEPELPARKIDAVHRLGKGVTTTMYLRFKERFWPEKMGFLFHCMSSQSFWPGRGRNVLTCYFGGKTSNDKLLALSDAALTEEVLSQLSIIFSKSLADMQSMCLGSEVWRWDTDPYAKMAYSYCPPGSIGCREILGEPCGTGLYFAGEASHPTKGSFAHGALEEGERAAEEVLSNLAKHSQELWSPAASKMLRPAETQEVNDLAKSGDGSLANVGIKLSGSYKCTDCRQMFETERASKLHWRYIHDPNRSQED